jgi:ubiquinone/menaquinone biosynthesis C-methylase UbiE
MLITTKRGNMPDHPEIYRHQAQQYEDLVTREDYQNNIIHALEKLIVLEGLSVAELGAGTGRLTCQLVPFVKTIHAFDISQHMLDVAIKKLKKSGYFNWFTSVSDHHHILIEDNSVDLVISGWSVCYVVVDNPQTWQEELQKVIIEMQRVLHPGGKIILIETLGTGFKKPQPPENLIPYFNYLEAHGFHRTWIRTDYLFDTLEEAETLSRFFFGDEMAKKIQRTDKGFLLPECTGIWTK